jgi:hypothetical protein
MRATAPTCPPNNTGPHKGVPHRFAFEAIRDGIERLVLRHWLRDGLKANK